MGGSLPKLTGALVRLADLPADRATPFQLELDAPARAAAAQELGIPRVRKLRLEGTFRPLGAQDWELRAKLGATVVQDCVVTLAPVSTRIDEPLERRYLAQPPAPDEDEETEMPEDDSAEPLPEQVDLGAVLLEALALALPVYPRAPDAALAADQAIPAGATPLDPAQEKPFAGLADLKAQLDKDG